MGAGNACGRGLCAAVGRALSQSDNARPRYVAQEKSKLWPQAAPEPVAGDGGAGRSRCPAGDRHQLLAIGSFEKQQFLNRDALIALFAKVGPGILLVHSQAGAFD
jgi:hypothetical protein